MVVLTREQLEDRLAALHRASLELVTDLSLDTLLEKIVTLAREQAGARYAALGVVNDNGDLVNFIPIGMPEEEVKRMSHPPQGSGLLGIFRQQHEPVRITDITHDTRQAGFPSGHPQMRSFLAVPILHGDQLLGQIYLTDKQGHFEFTEADQLVLETLAAYAAAAIHNARLYQGLVQRDHELCARNEDLALLNDIASSLAGSLDVDDILDKTLCQVMDYLVFEAGEIFLLEDSGRELQMAMHRGAAAQAFWTRDSFRLGEGLVGIVAQSGEPQVNIDPATDLRYLRRAVSAAGFRSLSFFPLTARGNVIGVIGIGTSQEHRLEEREIQLLMAIGRWSGLTIENARLHRQARRLAVLEERERIGMDLHDGIIQSIYGVGLALDYARMALEEDPLQTRQKIESSIEALNGTIRDIRSYILDLRPRQFHGEDLKQGLQRLVDEFHANSHTRTALTAPENGLVDFPADNARALFHICQEALANIAKHGHAKQATINLWTTRERVLLEITDNGAGFDLRKMSVTLGHGLSNMHTRARKVGGDVEITSTPGEGTTVLAWVPRHP